jgi:tetratricopeptide (TPR) repeat protein
MVERGERRRLALIADQGAEDSISPAEAQHLLCQRLDSLARSGSIEPDDVHRLIRSVYLHNYHPGEIIVPRGVRAGCLGLVVRGQVAVQTGGGQTARTEVVLLPGSTFGEGLLLEGKASSTTLKALTSCDIWFIHRDDLQALETARQAEARTSRLRHLGRWALGLAALGLVLLGLLSLASVRRTLALVPMGLGQWCARQGWDGCAAPAWTAAANLSPADANPLLALGTLYFEQGEIGAAERAFEAARDLNPDLPEVYNNLGVIYARQGEHERAIAAFQEALSLEPGIATTERNLGFSLQAIHAYDEAIDHYQTALALGEPQTSTLASLAIAYYEAGQPDQAANVAREALLYDERLAPAYMVLGAVALKSRQPEEALPDLQRAIALDAGYGQAYFYLGLAYKSLDRSTEAIVAFEQALIVADDEATRVQIRRHLSELYEVEKQSRAP